MTRPFASLLLSITMSSTAYAQVLQLPAPTGKHAVGVASTILVDSSRDEANTPTPDDKHELPLRIWYPAARGSAPAAYLADSALWVPWLGVDFFRKSQRVRTNAREGTAPLRGEWPVVFFDPGAGQVPEFYTTLLEDLASHGFVVVAFNHPYDLQPVRLRNGTIANRPDVAPAATFEHVHGLINTRVADIDYVYHLLARGALLNALPGVRIKYGTAIMVGHSRGGVTAFEACKLPKRFLACLNLDGGVLGGAFYEDSLHTGLKAPAVWLQMIHDVPSDAQLTEWKMSRMQWDSFDIRANRALARGPATWRIVLDAKSHMGFSDRDWVQADSLAAESALRTLLDVRRFVTGFAGLAVRHKLSEMRRLADQIRITSFAGPL